MLVLHTPGGELEPAFLISKLCRERGKKGYAIAVPRQATSAGTLICCGADTVHMGSLSRLGPIDPQINKTSVLSIKHSSQHLAELVSKFPGAADMFAVYVAKSLGIEKLGYYERVGESAVQYAEGLLRRRIVAMDADRDPGQIANRLVCRYKDHGFVIDHDEAVDVFGSGMIRSNTEEYDFANKVYEWLSLVSTIVDERGRRQFFYVGGRQLGAEIINMGAPEGQQQSAR